jgi:hypothetical protein
MEAALSSETSLNFYNSTFRCILGNQFYSSVIIVKISVRKQQVEFIRFFYLNYAPAVQHDPWNMPHKSAEEVNSLQPLIV